MNKEWRKRQVILDEDLVKKLYEWHGGQRSPVYRLASIGQTNLVSLSMIDDAEGELAAMKQELRKKERRAAVAAYELGKVGGSHVSKPYKEICEVLGELETVRAFWDEHSAKRSGMGIEENEYEYDDKNYGYSSSEEDDINTKSG